MRRMSERTIRRAAVKLIRIQLPVLFLLCTMLIGITAGFLISSDSVTNRLSCGYNSAVIRENYEAPETFAKGESYTKEVSVRNEGSVPCYVRVFAEVSNPKTRAVLDVDYNTSCWSKKSDGYYYYSRILKAGEVSEPLFTTLTAKENVNEFEMICYSETVQAYGFAGPEAAFAAIR